MFELLKAGLIISFSFGCWTCLSLALARRGDPALRFVLLVFVAALLNVHKGCSFYEFLNDLRHQESLRLLDNPRFDLTIADVAYQAGFNNRNTFYKVFKQKLGQTPQQYRNARRAG